jgi:hypothetical protein
MNKAGAVAAPKCKPGRSLEQNHFSLHGTLAFQYTYSQCGAPAVDLQTTRSVTGTRPGKRFSIAVGPTGAGPLDGAILVLVNDSILLREARHRLREAVDPTEIAYVLDMLRQVGDQYTQRGCTPPCELVGPIALADLPNWSEVANRFKADARPTALWLLRTSDPFFPGCVECGKGECVNWFMVGAVYPADITIWSMNLTDMRRLATIIERWVRSITYEFEIHEPRSRRSSGAKGKPGRRGYPIEAWKYARDLRTHNPGLKVEAIMLKCRERFSQDDLPPDSGSFRSWLNRKRSNRTN